MFLNAPQAPPSRTLGDPPEKLIGDHKVKIRVLKPTEEKSENVFYHSGDIGDIIYSLAFVKAKGGGDFYVGPDTKWELASKGDPQRYQFILPLIAAQDYIRKAEYAEISPKAVNIDLNRFREWWFGAANAWRKAGKPVRLVDAYFERFGVKGSPDAEPWLTAPSPFVSPDHPVIVHRSSRYNNNAFPWHEVGARYGGRMIFVGFPQEYEQWRRVCQADALFIQPENALELARIVAGGRLFIGNQSSPMSIAIGLGKSVVQETCLRTPDCVMHRKNFQSVTSGEAFFPEVSSSDRREIKFHLPRRHVVPIRTGKDNRFEIGLCADAFGLGDALTVTPIARALGKDCILRIHPDQAKYAFLFKNLCETEINEDAPVFRHVGGISACKAKLDLFNLKCSPLPFVDKTTLDLVKAESELKSYPNPVCFVPTCSPKWEHFRQRPAEFWEPLVRANPKATFLQFGRAEYPTVAGAVRMPFVPLPDLAAMFAVCQRYVGVDTGDAHLMVALGGSAVIAVPDETRSYVYKEWIHISDLVLYVKLSRPQDLRIP